MEGNWKRGPNSHVCLRHWLQQKAHGWRWCDILTACCSVLLLYLLQFNAAMLLMDQSRLQTWWCPPVFMMSHFLRW